MNRKILIPLLLLAVVGSGLVYYKEAMRPQGMTLTGIVTTDDVVVSSQVQGQLAKLLAREGDRVQAGQLLAVIQPHELAADQAYYSSTEQAAAAQVNQAEAALKYQESQTRDQIRQAEAALASAQAQVTEAAADLERLRLDYQRNQDLFKDGAIPAQQLDQARTTFEAQKAHLESLQKQVEAQRAAVALARSTEEQIQVRQSELKAMERQRAAAAAQNAKAKVRLDYTEIRAPIPAVVALDAARQGEVVRPTSTVSGSGIACRSASPPAWRRKGPSSSAAWMRTMPPSGTSAARSATSRHSRSASGWTTAIAASGPASRRTWCCRPRMCGDVGSAATPTGRPH